MPRQMPASQPRFMWAVLMLLSCPRYLAVSSQYYQCTQEKYEDKLEFYILDLLIAHLLWLLAQL